MLLKKIAASIEGIVTTMTPVLAPLSRTTKLRFPYLVATAEEQI